MWSNQKKKKNTCVYRSYNSNTTIHVSHGTMSKRNNSNSQGTQKKKHAINNFIKRSKDTMTLLQQKKMKKKKNLTSMFQNCAL